MEHVYLVIGLGNPGKKYRHTRHNFGFMVVDFLASRHKVKFVNLEKLAKYTTFECQSAKIILVKPQTYMNLSGLAVKRFVQDNQILISNVMVICDDLNLPFGVVRMRSRGSDGGQKGLRSIIDELNSNDFPRLRIGIGNEYDDAVEYVLSEFDENEKGNLNQIIQSASDAVIFFVENGIELAMSRFNRNVLE